MLYMDGRMRTPATRYARITEGPVSAAAMPGSRKNPELNIAPVLIAYTSYNVSSFFRLLEPEAMCCGALGEGYTEKDAASAKGTP
jgi:hypothetical protein